MNRNRGNLSIILLLLLSVVILAVVLTPTSTASSMQYSEMVQYFRDEKVSEFTLDLGSGRLKMTVAGEQEQLQYKVGSLSLFVNDVGDYIRQYDEDHPDAPMQYDYIPAKETSWFVSMLPTLILLLAMLGLFF